MKLTKKQKCRPKLDEYEQDIEDNLDVSKLVLAKEKAVEIVKLKTAAKEHIKKK
jgi:hypothetical protein